jgi:prevent-host-death family protein
VHQEVNVREARRRFASLLDAVEAGDEVVITRRGKQVARLLPPEPPPKQFPDLSEFRKSITMRGESLYETLMRMRREERGEE